MKSNITKFATAAIIVIAVIISVSFLNRTGSVAYSIEQTIEAMKKVYTLHAFGRMDDGSEYECFVELPQDISDLPNIYLSLPSQLIVSTPQWSYKYNKQDNSLQTLNGDYLQARANFSNIIEWLYEEAVVPGLCNMTLEQIKGPDGNPLIQMKLTGEIEAIFLIDMQTKLLVGAEIFSGETGDYVIRTIDKIIYNEDLSEGIFDFVIPEGAKVIEQ